ncbi:MAG: lactonase family protein [Cyclobacteriaceae bacterium]|nr:lactonase family protein [Cyclobacteriaceae bacterium]
MISTVAGTQAQSASKEFFYIGTFTGRGSQGIYVFSFDRKNLAFTKVQVMEGKESPSFLALHPNNKYLYSVNREGQPAEPGAGSVSAFRIDANTGKLQRINEVSAKGAGPCHISIDPKGKFAYVSNYSSGNLSVYRILSDGSLSEATDVVQHEGTSTHPDRQKGPHMHSAMVSADGKFIYASDLGIDKVAVYSIDRETGKLNYAGLSGFSQPGSGPRHLALHPRLPYAYSAEELSSTVGVYRVNKDDGGLSSLQRIDMLPEDYKGTGNSAADIHVSPDGRFLYASNRGHDSLVVYEIDSTNGKLKVVGHAPTLGGHPRNFCMDQKGQFVMVANRDSDNVVVFHRDAENGLLRPTGVQLEVPMAVCVVQYLVQ